MKKELKYFRTLIIIRKYIVYGQNKNKLFLVDLMFGKVKNFINY